MYKNRVMQHIFSEGMINQFLTSGNSLGIIQSNYFWDLEMSHLTLLIETDQMFKDEIEAKRGQCAPKAHLHKNRCYLRIRL